MLVKIHTTTLSPLVLALEEKRKELGESQAEFAQRIQGLGQTKRDRAIFYNQIIHGKKSFPRAHLIVVAHILFMSVEDVLKLAGRISSNAFIITLEEMEAIVSIVKVKGNKIISLDSLIKWIELMRIG